MREIKFRVWDKHWKKFIDRRLFEFRSDGSLDYNSSMVEVQQFTGMKTKSGVEVYEGDILAEKHDGGEGEANIGVVFFAAGTFMVNGDGALYERTYSSTPDILEDYEVIGNKFENPELLVK